MTKKLFWQNPYQTEILTTVTSISENDVTLKETIFFAFAGGQESDSGTIDAIAVTKATKDGLQIIYSLEKVPNFKVGDSVVVQIDWPRRYALMKLHFAAELVLVVCQKLFPGIQKIGAHISQDKSRIDFLWSQNLNPYLEKIQNEVQQIIDSNFPIISGFSDELTERRFWEIEGIAKVPCGGTHPKTTKELGIIHLRRDNCGKGKERIIICLKDFEKKE